MRRIVLPFIIAFSFYSVKSNAQVGINTTTPASTLEVIAKNATGTTSNVDGILIPRVNRQRAQSMVGVPVSTLIYVTGVVSGTQTGTTINMDTIGYYYFDGSVWIKLKSGATQDVNIYNSNGSLTEDRIVSQGANTLTFNGTATNAFSVDGSTFSVDAANNRVGIINAAPLSTLDIVANNPTGTSTNVDGILIPRVNRERAQSMTGVPVSTLIYVTGVISGSQTGTTVNMDSVGYYYFNGTVWVKMKSTDTTDVNIYNANGSLTGDRIVTQGTNTLAFPSNVLNAFSVGGNVLSVDTFNNRVGIGTTTPSAQLQLSSIVANRKIVMFQAVDNDNQFSGFGINSNVLRYQVSASNGNHVFYSGADATTSNELMRIQGTGNVGIGTSSPGVRLDVAQPIGISEATQLRILNTSPVATNNTAYIGFNSYNGGGATWGIGSVQNSTSVTDSNFNILYSNGGNYLKYVTVRPNGNVGLNTTAPTSLLSVNGTADKVGGGSWGTFSDSRMKKNVQPYTKGLPEILKINTVTFQYNGKGGYSDDGKTYTGVIAQEIEKVLPETVTKIKSSDFDDQRKYDSSEITYTLINAIKEQQKLIENQNKQIKELQADVQILKAKK